MIRLFLLRYVNKLIILSHIFTISCLCLYIIFYYFSAATRLIFLSRCKSFQSFVLVVLFPRNILIKFLILFIKWCISYSFNLFLNISYLGTCLLDLCIVLIFLYDKFTALDILILQELLCG